MTSDASSHPSPEGIFGLALGFWGSKTLLSAIELGLFSALGSGPRDRKWLEAELGLHPRSSRDFLDALVALGMLERTDETYTNTPATDFFLDRAKPPYIGGLFEMANARLYPFWANLTTALQTGEPQNEVAGGGDIFAELYADQAKLRQFLGAMTGASVGSALAIAAKFPWAEYSSFIDIGCAQGAAPVHVALNHPHLTGGGFDLPPVGPIFTDYVAAHGLADRVSFHPGSFFDDPLPAADVLVMGHILHDWDLDTKMMLLRKAYDALPDGGALIVYEMLIDDDRRQNAAGLLMSLNMLIETPGGFDYSGADCAGWMREVGFKEIRVEHLGGPESMVVAIK